MNQRLLRRVCLGWIAIVTAYFLVEAATYTGLYRWLAELQLWRWFFYLPMQTLFLLVAFFSLPALVVLLILRRRRRKEMRPETLAKSAMRFAERLMKGLFAVSVLFGLIAAGVLAFAFFGLPSGDGYARVHAVGEAEREMPTEGSTQLIGTSPGRVGVYGTYWMLGYKHIGFAPAASSVGLRGVRYFVEVPADRNGLYPRFTTATTWTGILVEGGLPGAMQRLFRANGYIIPQRYYTLYQSEASMRIVWLVRVVQFAVVALLFLGFAFWQRRNVSRMRGPVSEAT
jgi:hypothetical protein